MQNPYIGILFTRQSDRFGKRIGHAVLKDQIAVNDPVIQVQGAGILFLR